MNVIRNPKFILNLFADYNYQNYFYVLEINLYLIFPAEGQHFFKSK